VPSPGTPPHQEPIDRRPELLPDDRARARRGAIELVVATLTIAAVVALAVWFVFLARHPLLH
jgi:hypothetical protein